MILDQSDWRALVLVLERAQAVTDDDDRREAHRQWASEWGFRVWEPPADYQAWRKAAYTKPSSRGAPLRWRQER